MNHIQRYLKEFMIPFSSLKNGVHQYTFDIDELFFTHFKIEDVIDADMHIDFILEKKENMMQLDFELSGNISLPCDRCLGALKVDIVTTQQQMVKFSDSRKPISQDDETLIVLDQSVFELDIAPLIYEFITVEIPLRKVHPVRACNPEVIKMLLEQEQNVHHSTSNLWDKLKVLHTN